MSKTTKANRIEEIKASIDSLQVWFASKSYGWREQATTEQLKQWADREQEQDSLIAELERVEG